jgi:glutamyl-tRNA reductase
MKKVIETAKQVYTETSISTKPVSVVSLAYQYLKQLNIPLEARILIVGAGVTNTTMARFLKKHGFKNFQVFNRSLENSQKLAAEINGNASTLDKLASYNEGFDVLITCTAADGIIITPELYSNLLNGDVQEKIVIDLAIPQDLDQTIIDTHSVKYLSIEYLQRISKENAKERSKEIRATAYTEIFKEDLDNLDPQAKEVLDKVVSYLEKKYISGPMKLAKEIILNHAD